MDELALARRHVVLAEEYVVRQREIVAELERDGHDVSRSQQLLAQFEEVYQLHVADRDRLERELIEASKQTPWPPPMPGRP